MKPLARWTIGPSLPQGIDCLKQSIKFFKKIYPEFDRIVCYNQIEKPNITEKCLKQIGNEIDIVPLEDNWKFYPPNINNTHELFIDNDLIITTRIKEIDEFISGSHIIATEGLTPNFGQFNINRSPINTGLIGIPKYFDLGYTIKKHVKEWKSRFDNQGLLAVISQNYKVKIIPKTDIVLYLPNMPLGESGQGHHFLRLNSAKSHIAWEQFKSSLCSI